MGPVDWHYHSFHKILVLLAGRASYAIEGQSYALEPGDVVLVPRGSIHRPEIAPGQAYERYILYIAPEFLQKASTAETDLGSCFRLAAEKYSYVLRPDREVRIVRLLETLRDSQAAPGYGQELLDKALVTQFLIAVTRDLEARQLQYVASASCDEKIVSILKYLNLHLSERQSIDSLSRQFYISKYYMMRRFKAETGYTIHGYLTEKRLLLARERIRAGRPWARSARPAASRITPPSPGPTKRGLEPAPTLRSPRPGAWCLQNPWIEPYGEKNETAPPGRLFAVSPPAPCSSTI